MNNWFINPKYQTFSADRKLRYQGIQHASLLRPYPFKRGIIFFMLFLLSPMAFSNDWVTGTIKYCFTPGENCTQEIVDRIQHAQKTLWIQAYQFTSLPIAEAVITAKQRGVDVRMILDKTQCTQKPNALVLRFSQAGIPVWIDNTVNIAHNKIIIIDEHDLISGSFNFSKAAQTRNAENVLMIKSPELAKAYAMNWKNRQTHSLTLNDYLTLKNIRHKAFKQKYPEEVTLKDTWLGKAIDNEEKTARRAMAKMADSLVHHPNYCE